MSKFKKYGFSYDYSNKVPLHKFCDNKGNEIFFYKELKGYVALQKSAGHQQRVELDDRTLNNMLGTLDRHGWQEIAV